MASDFQTILNKREYKCLDTIRGVFIIDTNDDVIANLLEEALDQLYIERQMEEGKCTMCQSRTSCCCSCCGTPYCSVDCQKSDWPYHQSTCLRPHPGIVENHRKPNQKETDVISETDGISETAITKRGTKLQLTSSPTSSVDDIEKNDSWLSASYNHGDYVPSIRTSSKNRGKKSANGNHNAEARKKQDTNQDKKSHRPMENGDKKQFRRRTVSKNFAPERELLVKITAKSSRNFWVIKKGDEEIFEQIQLALAKDWTSFPLVTDIGNGVYCMRYNGKWHRCRVLNQEVKKLVRCVDTGQIFCPKVLQCLELPPHLKAEDDLAFKVIFQNPPEEVKEWIKVKVLTILPNGIYKVKLLEDKKNEESKIEVENKEEKEERDDEGKNLESEIKKPKKWHGIIRKKAMLKKVEHKEKIVPLRKNVFDELKPAMKGIFLPGKVGKEELLGCLSPEDIIEAMFCYNKINGLYASDGKKVDAKVGQDVLVAGDDTIGRRGIVRSKTKGQYIVDLVDYGYTVETNEVYEMPEKLADMIHLACRVTLQENSPRWYDEFEVKRAYEFEVIGNESNLLCKFAIYPNVSEVFAYGTVNNPWKREQEEYSYVPFQNGCKVIITEIGEENNLYIKCVDETLEEMLGKVNSKLNKFALEPDVCLEAVEVGDVVMSQYYEDNLWYRARVVQKTKEGARIIFVDYGNFQNSPMSRIKPMPDGIDEPFFTRSVTLTRDDSVKGHGTFSAEGRNYLNYLKKYDKALTMKYSGSDISEGVLLFDEKGEELNEIVFHEKKPEVVPIMEFDKEKFLRAENFAVGLVKNFICLHLDQEFSSNGVFWAVNGESSNFKYVVELSSKLPEFCENKDADFSAEIGMPCIAKYEDAWYRAIILDKMCDDVKVLFVDFGNSVILNESNLRSMVPDLFQVPATAVKCVLNGYVTLSRAERQKIQSFMYFNLNNPLKNVARVVKVVENENYVEFIEEVSKIDSKKTCNQF